ncbi:NUDIX domain protein [Posidoniimonas polymericola]|uniref:NUDIX domain protein n=1 Tax=Posidoniimonas polymericola TaxID=2528002 RepID=A0A5C5ZDR3_9BACT|nr:NUDIX hydrolase [Posidoniimonas polymericola]TWT85559.1 NUDIX domain protein [Posidoniimonas polymericola]
MNDPLLQILDQYQSAHPDEAAMVERVRALASTHDDCFERTCVPGHITGSAWVLSPDRTQCLLLHHRKLDKWLQPGGHADGDRDVLRVAIREATEESGLDGIFALSPEPLDIDVHRIPERRNAAGEVTEPAHEHHDLRFLLATDQPTPIAVSDESHDVRWCTPREVHALTQEESVLRLLRKSERWLESR